jgi:hypothetical protein
MENLLPKDTSKFLAKWFSFSDYTVYDISR